MADDGERSERLSATTLCSTDEPACPELYPLQGENNFQLTNSLWPASLWRTSNLSLPTQLSTLSDDLEDGVEPLKPVSESPVRGIISDTKLAAWFYQKLKQQREADAAPEKKSSNTLLKYSALAFAFLGLLTYLLEPSERVQEWGMRISPGSRYLSIWEQPTVTIYTKVYIFNFTNTDDFLHKRAKKLRVQEIGPFTYIETLKNTKVMFHENDTMSYTPKRSVTFVPELSVADPKDVNVIVPNIPLLGLASMVADSSMITNLGLLSAIKYLGSKPFLNLTVEEYLWGYDDPLVEIAHTVVSSWVPFAKLGLLDRMYDEGDNNITIRLKDNGLPVTDPGYLPQYSIETWNGSPGLETWGYNEEDYLYREEPLRPEKTEKCRIIQGGTEGILFPRHIDPRMSSYVYRKPFCRTTPIEFKRQDSFMPGITGFWYGLPDDVFDTPEANPEQKCYCDPDKAKCLPKGLSDITPCYYNIPSAVSLPHFLNADPSVISAIDGLSPDFEKHSSEAVIQPDLGTIISTTSRIQTNLVTKNIRYNSDLIPLSNLHIPFFWIELNLGELPTESVVALYALLVVIPAVELVTIILGSLGAIYVCFTYIMHWYQRYIFRRTSFRRNKHLVRTFGSAYTPAIEIHCPS